MKAVNNVSTSYIKLCCLNSNELIKIAHLKKLANESMLNGALVIEMVKNSFIESKKRKNWDMGSEKYIYLNIEFIRKCKRTGMLLIFGTDFSKLGVYSKSVTKTLYWTFLVSEGISLSLSEMQVIRYFLCLRDIGKKSLNRLLDCYCCLSLKTATGDVL